MSEEVATLPGSRDSTALQPSLAELIELWAVDSTLFNREFFPQTVRQSSPKFHVDALNVMEGTDRYCSLEMFRGSAKTTLLRMFTAKRVAYAISRTILYVGKSEDHAVRSVRWLKNQIEKNKKLCDTFGLKKGSPWTDSEIQIINGVEDCVIYISAFGITGSTRGVNFDDYRPDLIIIDDVVDEENSSTPEQRQKILKLVFGALKESLAPRSESPFAKMIILQTPQDFEDLSQVAAKDSQFVSVRFGCWTKETENLPLEQRESAWPERWTSEELRQEKLAAIKRNMLSIFAREMECSLVTPENSKFREEWLRYWGEGAEPLPPVYEMWKILVIDPVPPPSEREIMKGFANKDYEAFGVVGRWKGRYYLLESTYNRGHEPNWTVAEFFRLCDKWRPRKVLVESTAYQRTLAWLLRQAMQKAGRYWMVETTDDKRSKLDVIVDGISGVASNGQLYINRVEHSEFYSQFIHYPNVKHDDVIEVVARGLTALMRSMGEEGGKDDYSEEDIPPLENYRGAP